MKYLEWMVNLIYMFRVGDLGIVKITQEAHTDKLYATMMNRGIRPGTRSELLAFAAGVGDRFFGGPVIALEDPSREQANVFSPDKLTFRPIARSNLWIKDQQFLVFKTTIPTHELELGLMIPRR